DGTVGTARSTFQAGTYDGPAHRPGNRQCLTAGPQPSRRQELRERVHGRRNDEEDQHCEADYADSGYCGDERVFPSWAGCATPPILQPIQQRFYALWRGRCRFALGPIFLQGPPDRVSRPIAWGYLGRLRTLSQQLLAVKEAAKTLAALQN